MTSSSNQRQSQQNFTRAENQNFPKTFQQLTKITINQKQPSILKITKIQKNIRCYLKLVKFKTVIKKIRSRQHVIKQLLKTQEGYIRDLGYIVSDFMHPLKTKNILKQHECKQIFANIDGIRKLHDQFYAILYNHSINYHPYRIIFKDVLLHIKFFKIYTEYINNFTSANDKIDEYKKNKSNFNKFVNEVFKNQKYRGLKFQDFLIMPIQRGPRYLLLLKQLLKNTEQQHPDYQNIKEAIKRFEEVNSSNNQKLIKIRNCYKIRELESMLQLSEGIITQSTQFIMEDTVQILTQFNKQITCVMYLLNSAIIVTRRSRASLRSSTDLNTHTARTNRISGALSNEVKQKLQELVPLKYGTSLHFNKNRIYYRNCFTVQSPQGQSCTFVCLSQDQLHNLSTQIKKQIDIIRQQTTIRMASMYQSCSQMLQLLPQIKILGTTQRTDYRWNLYNKYTVYIVQVKIKIIKKKIFLRFSQLLEVEKFIKEEFPQMSIKQGLVIGHWLKSNKDQIIQERQMNIQRFLQQILSKPQIMNGQNRYKVLIRLGLPQDLYQLPQKITKSKILQNYRRSLILSKSAISRRSKKQQSHSSRLSLIQQVKIQQQQEIQDDQVSVDQIIKRSTIQVNNVVYQTHQFFHHQHLSQNSKNSLEGHPKICLDDILQAIQIDQGLYPQINSKDNENQNNSENNKQKLDFIVHVPSLATLYSQQKKIKIPQLEYISPGFNKISIKFQKNRTIDSVVQVIGTNILKLKCCRDLRLLMQKQFSQRIIDNNQLVYKILHQANQTNSIIVLRKIIYINNQIQQSQYKQDINRLMFFSAQIINQIKMDKYRFGYQNYLKFAVLSFIAYSQLNGKKKVNQHFALQAKQAIFPKYTILSNSDQTWIDDFIKAEGIIREKLENIVKTNCSQNNLLLHQNIDCYSLNTYICIEVFTKIEYLAMLQIIKEIERDKRMYGCSIFSVHITDQLKKYLINKAQSSLRVSQQTNSSERQQDDQELLQTEREQMEGIWKNFNEQENKSCWLGIKHNKIQLISLNKNQVFLTIDYEYIIRSEPFPSSIILYTKIPRLNKIVLKTKSSHYIKQILLYYQKYPSVIKKIYNPKNNQNEIVREDLIQQDMEEHMV